MAAQFKPIQMASKRLIYPVNMMSRLLLLILALLPGLLHAAVTVNDDAKQTVVLDKPAKRVVSLSPGMTELIFAAGGGDKIKGVVSFSDFPPEAKNIPQIGSYNAIDIEQIVALNPDLVVAWQSGNPPQQISRLKQLGVTVYISEPRRFADIPRTLRNLGQLLGTGSTADNAARQFESKLTALRHRYSADKAIAKTVFIQIWDQPIMSVSGEHLISRIVEFCHGQNVFHETNQLTLSLSAETVLQKNPDVILVTREGELGQKWLMRWKPWEFMSAVKNDQLFMANPDYLVRHTPRVIQGIKQVCGSLQPHLD